MKYSVEEIIEVIGKSCREMTVLNSLAKDMSSGNDETFENINRLLGMFEHNLKADRYRDAAASTENVEEMNVYMKNALNETSKMVPYMIRDNGDHHDVS